MNPTTLYLKILMLLMSTFGSCSLFAQINYVPNHSFEDISDCDLNFGDVPKAIPWNIVNFPETSPDLYHYCSTSGFYDIPARCGDITPKDGEGMVGQVSLVSEERIYVRLTEPLPRDIDIYVSFSTRAQELCGNTICHTNTQCLAFSDFAFQDTRLVLAPDTIITNSSEWTTMRTCYRADGTEDLVLIGNYLSAVNEKKICVNIDPLNFAYYFVDEIIVSPFDVVPDTLFLCGDESITLDATFYDLPIRWSDGTQGPVHTITEGGTYTVFGLTGNCLLEDQTIVIKIPDEKETFEVNLCEEANVLLESPLPAIWPNGDTSTTFPVFRPGVYAAELISDCGVRKREYVVTESDCSIQSFVPNVFSPNGDGINDELLFFFESDFNFEGQLKILDRWGNLLFDQAVANNQPTPIWNGSYRGKPLNTGVFIWALHYTSGEDGKSRTISGSITLLR